jgi:hypothetical protein
VYHKINTPYNSVSPTVSDNYYSAGNVSLVKLSGNVNPNMAGMYYEIYEAIDGSGNTTQKTRVVIVGDRSSSVHDVRTLMANISPNPSNAAFALQLPLGLTGSLRLVANDGKVVLEKNITDAYTIIETSTLGNGVYTLLLNDGQAVASARLLVQH